jgi:hypothetical protein
MLLKTKHQPKVVIAAIAGMEEINLILAVDHDRNKRTELGCLPWHLWHLSEVE